MIIASKKQRTPLVVAVLLMLVTAVTCLFIYMRQNITHAADISRFDPGNIMSDVVMSNKGTMSVQQIQDFLNSKNACNNTNTYMASWYPNRQYNIKNGKFVCMAQDSFDGQSAAQIIWQAAQDNNINPQVLLVLLEKEQGLVTDTWPNQTQYSHATGFACFDHSACDARYFGLKNQLEQAAAMFRSVLNGGWSNYPIGQTYVQYNPNAGCGGSIVNIKTLATSALYRYTPYQPNQSALNAGYGTGDSCGAYGNRNFWLLFTDWFGSTQSDIQMDMIAANKGLDDIYDAYKTQLGQPTTNVIAEYERPIRVWQSFQGGTIIWTQKYGAYAILFGDLYNRWKAIGGSAGTLGVPKNNAITESNDGRIWQDFEGGTIIYSNTTGAWEVLPGPLGDKWRETGGSLGSLGKPTTAVTIDNSMRKQTFEKGAVARTSTTSPAYAISGKIYSTWKPNPNELGAPSTDAQQEPSDGRVWQNFAKGTVIDSTAGTWSVQYGAINNKWRELGGSTGKLGRPTTNQTTESDKRVWQNFEKGTIIQKTSTTPANEILFGDVYNRWRQLGGSTGELGIPQSSTITETDGRTWQNFEKGTIIQSSATGSWEILGGFYTYWRQQGGSLGTLGKPTGERHIETNDTRWQNFEKGKAIWKPSSGWTIER